MNLTGASLTVLAITLTSCTSYRNVCGDLRDGLKRCGFAVTQVDCSLLAYSDIETLIEKLDDQGCDAFATGDDRSVDKRVCTLGHFACPASPTPDFTPASPKGPVVFIGGIDDSSVLDWSTQIVRLADGSGSHHLSVLPWATTPERAQDLWLSLQSLSQHARLSRVNLVCYAVAGLDCRFLVSDGGLFAGNPNQLTKARALISSITTIATPHRGTRVADAAMAAIREGTADEVLQALVGSDSAVHIPDDTSLMRTLDGLTPEALEAFNARVVDAPAVFYQSYAGVSAVSGKSSASTERAIREHCAAPDTTFLFQRHPSTTDAMNPALWATAPFSTLTRGEDGQSVSSPSDGMISVASAKWGVFRGCLPADHYDVIGQIGHVTRDPATGFDAPRFYQVLVSELAARGL